MGFDDGKQKMEKFDGSYFAFWKTHIEDYLYQKDLYRPLLVTHNILKEKTTVGLMQALKEMYEQPSITNKFAAAGYTSTFTRDTWRVSNGIMVAAKVKKVDTLYLTSHRSDTLAVLDNIESSNLWHNRLGHMSEKGMKCVLSAVLTTLLPLSIIIRERDKLDAKSQKCTSIGYDGDELGYHFSDDKNKKVMRIRDVVFNQKVMYKDKNNIRSIEDTDLDTDTSEYFERQYLPDDNRFEQGFSEIEERALDEKVSEATVSNGLAPETGTSSTVKELRGTARSHKPNPKYISSLDYLLLRYSGEPECFDEVLEVLDSAKWKTTMQEEMNFLHSNGTWQLAQLPAGKKALQNKWIYRLKQESDGKKRYKARLVVKGFQQKECIDYTEIFSPVVKIVTMRMVLCLVAAENLYLELLDVKTASLHGDLDEEIYMKQPIGFIVKGKEEMVCRLKKSLYGLKQAPRQWYKKFDGFMLRSGYTRCNGDHSCFFKRFERSYIILLLYVDDMLVEDSCVREINRLKQ
ncbi:hypothetical protein AXG93_3988s1200 [Marchantia polymorpha subsp. ruderalis]|uniref:Uncharacterized protein n=1 Tax=Marchantia polymorpha subsp. ruderalis TaxID=1480154 RepID=A0A176VLV9_MARPO|nr:hypothetical protein AXG93_3988s1200 [Marchantia polymorpha subsp. ruderalis]